MVKFIYYTTFMLGTTTTNAAPWNFAQDHELAGGTHTMPKAYDPDYRPIGKTAPTVIDTSGNCEMNPWIAFALLDSNYGQEKFTIFQSRNGPLLSDDLITGENNGKTNDAIWDSLINCKENKGLQKLVAIDAMANKRPDIVENIMETTTEADGTEHQSIKKSLYDSPTEFYTNYYKYNQYIKLFHDSGYGKWYKINQLFNIIGLENSDHGTRYQERKNLMKNLDQPMMADLTRRPSWLGGYRRSSYLPSWNTKYNQRPTYSWGNSPSYAPFNPNTFMAQPAVETEQVPLQYSDFVQQPKSIEGFEQDVMPALVEEDDNISELIEEEAQLEFPEELFLS